MDDTRVSAFGGIMGRVLRDSMSIGTAITGVILGLILLAFGFILGLVGASSLGMLFGQIVVAVALARFALNGMSGEWRGTILSTAGGSWPMALVVAGRYIVLNLLWVAPLLLLGMGAVVSATAPVPVYGSGDPSGSLSPGMSGMPGGAGGLAMTLPLLALFTSKTFLTSAGLSVLGMALLPPIFLIIAVRSAGFGDIFSPALWRATFSGRMGDLYALYSVHGGALGMLLILALPAALLTFAAGKAIGILFLFVALVFGGGLTVTLLGRLCGFFAFGEEDQGPAFATRPAGDRHRASGRASRPRPPEVFGSPEPAAELAPDASGKTPLVDASQRAAQARQRFETDPEGAVGELNELHAQHAPSPQIMHALALCLHKAGRIPEAVSIARQAMPLCIGGGHVVLAAEIYAALWKQARELSLTGAQINAVAAALAKTGDHARAITAYGMALHMDHGDRKAIKGLLQLADHKMHGEKRPQDAARIYTFLLQYASGTPFADDIRRGLVEAESRLARAS